MSLNQDNQNAVNVSNGQGRSEIVLVCEHASPDIPNGMNDLGLSSAARHSHVAWDPGALAVAEGMSHALDAVLVASTVSRLVYDCNRPPDAPDAIPTQSEAYSVPGNRNLSAEDKAARVASVYIKFRDTLRSEIVRRDKPIIVTLHSFTPVYNGKSRDVEIGILHDSDMRLADAMLQIPQNYDVRRNAPYGPDDGVTHTLKEQALKFGHLNVMIEVRNDLIATEASQSAMALTLAGWVTQALQGMGSNVENAIRN